MIGAGVIKMFIFIFLLILADSFPAYSQTDQLHKNTHSQNKRESSEKFSTSVTGLKEVKPTEEFFLKDGDSFEMIAAPVKQKINGKWMRRLAYNGMIPGPRIRVKQGSKIFLTLKNNTELDTTLHSHGLRVDDKNDGVPGVGQEPIKPGKSFTYNLIFKDSGIFWYHPHIREDYSQALGLYGNYAVEPEQADNQNEISREAFLTLEDVSTKQSSATQFYKNKVTHTLMGRFGDTILVNGKEKYKFHAIIGERVRFFVTNTSSARVYKLRLAGHRIKLVGGDNGLYEQDAIIDSLIISPSERYVFEVEFKKNGTFELLNDNPVQKKSIAQVIVKNQAAKSRPIFKEKFEMLHKHDKTIASFIETKKYFDAPPEKKFSLTVAMDHKKLSMEHAAHSSESEDGIEWEDVMPEMNAQSDDKSVNWKIVDQGTKKENMDIEWTLKKGTYTKVRFFNDPDSMHPMQHPIHFHGQRFVVSHANGVAQTNLLWKDTVLIPSGATIDIILENSNPGQWMSHCHISEHLGTGMMFGFKVLE